MGDLNCNFGSTVMDHNSTILTSITDLYGLQQLISEPTRITKSSSTLIDLIFTNSPDKIVCSGVSHISISDHSLIYAFRKLSTGLFTKGHSTVTYILQVSETISGCRIGMKLWHMITQMTCGMFRKIYLTVLLKDMHLCVQSVLGLLNRPGLPLI